MMQRKLVSLFWSVLFTLAVLFSLALDFSNETDNIVLAYFFADASEIDEIDLYWGTATETDIFGFYIERCLPGGDLSRCELTKNANYTVISSFYPGQGSSISGWDYLHPDYPVDEGVMYYYRLRVDNLDQSQDTYGPVWGIPGAPPTLTPTRVPTASRTPSQTPSATRTSTQPAQANSTATFTFTPTVSPSNTPTASSTPTLTQTPRPGVATNTVAAPVVSFTPRPSDTAEPSETPTEGPTPTETFTPTTTLIPLPSITLIWPSETPTSTETARRFTTATPADLVTPTPARQERGISVQTGFLITVVGFLWLLLGVFLFTYLRRLGQ